MRFKKIISAALALVGLLLSLTACLNAPERQIQRTQLVMFKSLSFYMPEKSFEEVFGKADEVVEEEEMAYRDTWRAEDPYFYKTGRHFYYYENISWNDYTVRANFTFSQIHILEEAKVYFSVSSKAQQKELVDNLSQIVKTELETLADYKSLTVEMVGIDHDTYQYKVKLQGKTGELRVEVSPTELGYHEKPEDKKYGVSISQYRRYTP